MMSSELAAPASAAAAAAASSALAPSASGQATAKKSAAKKGRKNKKKKTNTKPVLNVGDEYDEYDISTVRHPHDFDRAEHRREERQLKQGKHKPK